MNIKKIIINFFKLFGINLSINKITSNTNWKYLDINSWLPFASNNNQIFKIYNEGLYKSKSEKSDNTLKQLRFYSLLRVVENVMKSKNIQNFAECGCWKGHSTYSISKILEKNNFKNRFFVFDSFEGGLSDKNSKDINKNRYNQNIKEAKVQKNYFYSNYNEVKDLLKKFEFIKIYKNWIPVDFIKVSTLSFSFVHLDIDLYEPTFESLSFFYPRMTDGGIIVCDDYNSSDFPGATRAVNEFIIKNKVSFFYDIPLGGCILIK